MRHPSVNCSSFTGDDTLTIPSWPIFYGRRQSSAPYQTRLVTHDVSKDGITSPVSSICCPVALAAAEDRTSPAVGTYSTPSLVNLTKPIIFFQPLINLSSCLLIILISYRMADSGSCPRKQTISAAAAKLWWRQSPRSVQRPILCFTNLPFPTVNDLPCRSSPCGTSR